MKIVPEQNMSYADPGEENPTRYDLRVGAVMDVPDKIIAAVTMLGVKWHLAPEAQKAADMESAREAQEAEDLRKRLEELTAMDDAVEQDAATIGEDALITGAPGDDDQELADLPPESPQEAISDAEQGGSPAPQDDNAKATPPPPNDPPKEGKPEAKKRSHHKKE